MPGVKAMNFFHHFRQTGEDEIMMHRSDPGGLKQQRSAAHRPGGLGVLPFVADDKGTLEVQMPFKSGFGKQAGPWLPAGTSIDFTVRTHQNVVQWERCAQLVVHAVHVAACDGAP